MGRISVGEAIGAGFRLIGREPAAFAVWCGIYFLMNLLPQLAVWPQVIEVWRQTAAGVEPDPATFNRMGALQPLSLLLLLAMMAVLPAAVFRAQLFPEERRFFYLRVGMREFWVLIVTIVVALIWIFGFLGAMIPAMVLAFGGAFAAGGGGGAGAVIAAIIFFLAYIAAIAVSIWMVLRFSMAPVMSFAENTFRVPESWRLTKGHAWRLFLLALGLFAMMILTEVILFGAGLAALGAGTPNLLQTMSRNPAALFANVSLPAMIVASLVFSVFGVGAYVIGAAAWASVYRQLKPQLAETFA